MLVYHFSVSQPHFQGQLIQGLEVHDLEEAKGGSAVGIHYHHDFEHILQRDCVVNELDQHGQELLEVYFEAELLLKIKELPLVTFVNVLEEVIGVTEQLEPELVRVQIRVKSVIGDQEIRLFPNHWLIQPLHHTQWLLSVLEAF